MPQKKPTSVVVIAILQLVFGILGLLGVALNLSGAGKQLNAMNQQNQPIKPEQLEEKVAAKIPHYQLIQNVSMGISGVLCLLMILSGIGLLGLHSWARLLAIFYGILSILITLGSALYSFAVVGPAYAEIGDEVTRQGGPEAQMLGTILKFTGYIAAGCGLVTIIYPLIVLLIMFRPAVRAAFRGESLPTEPEDYRDQYAAPDVPEPDDRYQA
jgi:hypothetical protein